MALSVEDRRPQLAAMRSGRYALGTPGAVVEAAIARYATEHGG